MTTLEITLIIVASIYTLLGAFYLGRRVGYNSGIKYILNCIRHMEANTNDSQ